MLDCEDELELPEPPMPTPMFVEDERADSAEVALRPMSGLPSALSGSELYGFVDGGKVWYRARYGFPTETLKLASVGGGVRVAVKQKLELQLDAARGLSNPIFFLDRKDTRLIFTVRSLF